MRIFIETPLSIAYLKDNVITLKDGLDMRLKDDVFGIRLPNDVIVSIGFFNSFDWHKAKSFVSSLSNQDGKSGRLPTQDMFNVENCKKDIELFNNTLVTLCQSGINVSLPRYGSACDASLWLGDAADDEALIGAELADPTKASEINFVWFLQVIEYKYKIEFCHICNCSSVNRIGVVF